eukprot:3112632-Rhodomonas_salina.2
METNICVKLDTTKMSRTSGTTRAVSTLRTVSYSEVSTLFISGGQYTFMYQVRARFLQPVHLLLVSALPISQYIMSVRLPRPLSGPRDVRYLSGAHMVAAH